MLKAAWFHHNNIINIYGTKPQVHNNNKLRPTIISIHLFICRDVVNSPELLASYKTKANAILCLKYSKRNFLQAFAS